MRRIEVSVALLVSYQNWLTCTGMTCKSLILRNKTELCVWLCPLEPRDASLGNIVKRVGESCEGSSLVEHIVIMHKVLGNSVQ